MARTRSLLLLLLFWGGSCVVAAATAHVAVASNFKQPLEQLVEKFSHETGHRIVVSSASTGKLYAQIRNGAPYDLFLSADALRPRLLLEQGFATPDSLQTYAIGELALWAAKPVAGSQLAEQLRAGQFRHLAIANPKTAPYGLAAQQVLQSLSALEAWQGKLVLGENIGQTFHFVASGAADLGLVAVSQLRTQGVDPKTYWRIPQQHYQPIRQQLVLLRQGQENPAAHALLRFLQSDAAGRIIQAHGYRGERL